MTEQALGLLASHLGYAGRRQFLEDILVSLVKKWLEQEQPLLEFPVKLFEFETPKEFFRYNAVAFISKLRTCAYSFSPSLSAYRHHVVPLLVSQCDESTLESLSSDVLDISLHDLLKESLPACMVLILTLYTEQRSGGEGEEGGAGEKEKQLASNSHNLLTKILSEEVIVMSKFTTSGNDHFLYSCQRLRNFQISCYHILDLADDLSNHPKFC